MFAGVISSLPQGERQEWIWKSYFICISFKQVILEGLGAVLSCEKGCRPFQWDFGSRLARKEMCESIKTEQWQDVALFYKPVYFCTESGVFFFGNVAFCNMAVNAACPLA